MATAMVHSAVSPNYSLSANPYGIAAADINGDGYLDIAVTLQTNSANTVAVVLNNDGGAGNFYPESDVALGTGYAVYVALGDLNGDGKPDMVVSLNQGANYPAALVMALGNGDGTFKTPTAYPSSAQDGGFGEAGAANVQLVDFNGDGNLDLVYLNEDFGTVGLMLGNGDGTFGTPVEFPTTERAWGMALADLNNDGAIDVTTADDESGGVTVLLNDSGATANYSLGAQIPSVVVAAGSPATYDLTLAANNLYNGTITLRCTSSLPAGAACSFSPAWVVVHGNHLLSSALTITTTAPQSALARPVHPNSNPGAPRFLASLGGFGLFGLILAGKKRAHVQMGVFLGVMLLGMITLVACSGVSSAEATGTPPGSYTVIVTATGTGTGAPTHTLKLTLIVVK